VAFFFFTENLMNLDTEIYRLKTSPMADKSEKKAS